MAPRSELIGKKQKRVAKTSKLSSKKRETVLPKVTPMRRSAIAYTDVQDRHEMNDDQLPATAKKRNAVEKKTKRNVTSMRHGKPESVKGFKKVTVSVEKKSKKITVKEDETLFEWIYAKLFN